MSFFDYWDNYLDDSYDNQSRDTCERAYSIKLPLGSTIDTNTAEGGI